jgi:hypothetical protein
MNNNNDSKEGTEKPALLTELLGLVDKCKQAYEQERVFNRALALVMAELFAFGRHTITQLLLTLGIIDEDWSLDFGQKGQRKICNLSENYTK